MCLANTLFCAAHDADARAPVFVDVEAVDFDVGRDAVCESLERGMDAQGGRYEIDQRCFVSDRARPKEFCFRDVAAAAMCFDATPIISALQNVLAVF